MLEIILKNDEIQNLQEILKDAKWIENYEESKRSANALYNDIVYTVAESHYNFDEYATIVVELLNDKEVFLQDDETYYKIVRDQYGRNVKIKIEQDILNLLYEVWTPYWRYEGKTYNRPQLTEFVENNLVSSVGTATSKGSFFTESLVQNEEEVSTIETKKSKKLLSERVKDLIYYGDCDEGTELFQQMCRLAYSFVGLGMNDEAEVVYKWAKEHAEESEKWAEEDSGTVKGYWGN